MQAAYCHPERKHYCKGLCRSCYSRQAYAAKSEQVNAARREQYDKNRRDVLDKLRARRAADPEFNAKQRAYTAANREKLNARQRAWREANPEKANRHAQAWRTAHPEKVLARVHRRRARLKALDSPGVSGAEWLGILDVFGHACAYCLQVKKLTRDHVIPLARGGLDEPGNVVPACQTCNSRKNAGTLLRFISGRAGRMLP